jgi:dolichol kinase
LRGKIGEKSLSGTFAGIVTSSGVALMINQIIPSEIIIFGAVVAMVVEILPIPMNDNLTIPLSGGLTMHYGMMTL